MYDGAGKPRRADWQVPACTMPPDAEDVAVLRVVLREGFNRDMAEMFVDVDHFEGGPAVVKKKHTACAH